MQNATKKQILFLSFILIAILALVAANINRFSALTQVSNSESSPTAQIIVVTETPLPTIDPATATLTFTPTLEPTATSTPEVNGLVQVIGYSVQQRPLSVYQFGTGPTHLMIVADIHGGYESNTVDLANALIEKLKAKEILVPADTTLYILPMFNPDGYAKELGAAGRANADNVDLNRNWDANWSATWWGTQCWNKLPITAGSAAFSEPETQALSAFLLSNQIRALISYHSASLGIFPGASTNNATSLALASQLAAVSPYAYPPVSTDCEYTGQMVDWAAAQGIAAVDIELRTHSDPDLDINVKVLNAFLNWQSYLGQ